MERLRYIVAALMLIAAAVTAASRQEYGKTQTATTTSTEHGFGFPARNITVANDGAVTVYVDARCGTATSADPPVLAGETYSPPEFKYHEAPTCIAILSASATASVRIYAYE